MSNRQNQWDVQSCVKTLTADRGPPTYRYPIFGKYDFPEGFKVMLGCKSCEVCPCSLISLSLVLGPFRQWNQPFPCLNPVPCLSPLFLSPPVCPTCCRIVPAVLPKKKALKQATKWRLIFFPVLKKWFSSVYPLHIAWKYKPSQPIGDRPLWPCPLRVVSNFVCQSYQ